MKVGRLIRLKRKAKGMTQQDVANRTGKTRRYISDIECGRNLPGTETLVILAKCLDLDLNLLKEAGEDAV